MSMHCRKGPKMKVLGKIWENYRNSKRPEDPGSQKESRRGATRWSHPPRRGLAWPVPGHGVGPSGTASHRLFRLYILSDTKTIKQSASIHEKFQSTATIADEIRGTEVSILAPCQDGELPPEPSSSPLLTPMMRRE